MGVLFLYGWCISIKLILGKLFKGFGVHATCHLFPKCATFTFDNIEQRGNLMGTESCITLNPCRSLSRCYTKIIECGQITLLVEIVIKVKFSQTCVFTCTLVINFTIFFLDCHTNAIILHLEVYTYTKLDTNQRSARLLESYNSVYSPPSTFDSNYIKPISHTYYLTLKCQ